MRFIALLLLAATATTACGGSPTEPTTSTTSQNSNSQAGEAGPTPPAPAPAPTPTPTPPTPAPPPSAERWQGTATVGKSHWYYSPAPIEGSFIVEWTRQTLTFGRLASDVLAWEAKGDTIAVFARPDRMNLQIVFNSTTGSGTWILSGEPGQASGTLTVER